MKSIYFIAVLFFLSMLVFSACTGAPAASASTNATQAPATPGDAIPTSRPAATPTAQKATQSSISSEKSSAGDLARSDAQGMVTVTVIPLNLGQPGDTLNFEISLETHSVDLSMDLAKLSTLTTDQGNPTQAMKWDGPRGGHHVKGTLSFPGNDFATAKKLILTIKNVDAPSRVFTWNLGQ